LKAGAAFLLILLAAAALQAQTVQPPAQPPPPPPVPTTPRDAGADSRPDARAPDGGTPDAQLPDLRPPTPPPVREPVLPLAMPPTLAAAPPPASPPSRRQAWLGGAFETGLSGFLPDTSLELVYRPVEFLKAFGGVGFNLIGPGVKGGVTLVNPYFIHLSLTGELGHYFESDANKPFRLVTGGKSDIASLKKVGYDFANALVGLEFGTRFIFYFRGGFTFMKMQVHSFESTLKQQALPVSRASDPTISYKGPTFKTGFQLLFP
jgi:hypothetical protein